MAWESYKLDEYADILDHLRIPVNEEERSNNIGNTPYYGANGLQGFINGWIFDEPLILIAEDGGYFDEYSKRPVAYKIEGKSWVNNHAHILRPRESFDFDYVFFSLQHKNITPFIKGGTRAKLNQRELREIEIRAPRKKAAQKAISRILTTIDQSIEKTEALIEKYQQIKAGLMHDLFTRGIGTDGKLRPPREQAPELYQQTAIGWIPKEWEISTLRDKAKAGVPHLRTGPFGSSLKGEHWVDDGNPVITIGALGEGEFDVSELLFVDDLDAKRLYDFQMKFGDVVFSRVADVGRSVVINTEQIGWIMSSNLMRISLDQAKILPGYLQYQLSFDSRIKKQIRCKVNSGGRDVANSEVLNSLSFIWPGINEQKEIVMSARTISHRIDAERKKLMKLDKQKFGLMHDLLTGKVPVKIDTPDQEAT